MKHVVVAEGEKNKRISAIIQRPGVAVTVQPAPPPPQPQYAAPQPVQVYRPPTAPAVPVAVESNGSDLRVQFDSFQTGVHNSCTAPCSAMVPPGMYARSESQPEREPRRTLAVRFSAIGGPGTLRARWVSRTGLKIGGAFLLAGGIIGGIGLLYAGASAQTCDYYDGYSDCS